MRSIGQLEVFRDRQHYAHEKRAQRQCQPEIAQTFQIHFKTLNKHTFFFVNKFF